MTKRNETVTVTITLTMPKRMAISWLQNSLERVINTSTSLLIMAEPDNEFDEEKIQTNLEDWDLWKQPIVHVWQSIHDALFRKFNNLADKEDPYQVTGW